MPLPSTLPKPVPVYRTQPLRLRLRVWLRLPFTLGPEDEGQLRDIQTDFGSTWAAHIRPLPDSGRVVACTVTIASLGVLDITATGDQTALLEAGVAHGMDVRATNDDDENSFIIKADVTVDGAYTRDA